MKKKLLLSILGMAAASAFGQGYIALDNYISGGPIFTYGLGVPANGVSGALGTIGTGLNSGWTAGIYFAVGTPSIVDPAGYGMPDAALSLGTGSGSTAQFFTSTSIPGEFQASQPFNTGAPVGSTITLEIVAYDTADGSYAAASYRMHTAPFTMTTASNSVSVIPLVGDAMIAAGITGYNPIPVSPEPSTFALAGLGACLWMVWVRRKNF